jgi:hypothetical protein
MNSEEFCRNIHQAVVVENSGVYRELLEKTNRATVSDDHWKRLLLLFDQLHDQQKETLLATMRQVAVDTCSNLLGILDGTTCFDSSNADFQLIHNGSGRSLSGDLQEIFLAIEQSE